MPTAAVTYTFTAHTNAAAAQVNKNFQDLLDFLNVTKLGSGNISAEGVYGNIVSAIEPMSGGSYTASGQDIPGCTYTTATAGTFLVWGTITASVNASSTITETLLVDGVQQTAAASLSVNGTASQVWRVTTGSGKILKLRSLASGSSGTVSGAQLAVLQVG